MKIANALKKIEKAGGSIEEIDGLFVARFPGKSYRIQVRRNGGDYTDDVSTIRVIRDNDHDDMQSDYYAGTWVEAMSRAIKYATTW